MNVPISAESVSTLTVRDDIHPDLAIAHSGRDLGNMDPRFSVNGEYADNRELLVGTIGLRATNVAVMRPVHGTEVTDIGEQVPTELDESDALVTTGTHVGLLIASADCLPLAIFGEGQAEEGVAKQILALVHLSRATISGKLHLKTIDHMVKKHGFKPETAVCYAGPSIKPESYVGSHLAQDVRDNLERWKDFVPKKSDGYRIDLRGLVECELEACGVPLDAMHDSGIDTGKDDSHFSYYRYLKDATKSPNGRNGFVVVRTR
jgi:purine-nucleoside/S-methyl-5'-thioadenosine phosphorylase / adenosine deaminase